MSDTTVIGTGTQTLVALLICGVMGLLGQGVRAVVGLKNANSNTSTTPDQQSEFNAAYLFVSLMIGLIAGILAGLVTGLGEFINSITLTKILGVAAAGYVGADFVENSMSLVLPKGTQPSGGRTAQRSSAADQSNKSQPQTQQSLAGPSTQTIIRAAWITGPDDIMTSALLAVAPGVNSAKWVPALNKAFIQYELQTDQRKAAAIGQFLVEAGPDFAEVTENLYYTHVEAIMRAFGGHFQDSAEAEAYLRNPTKLANKVYADSLGNGNEGSGDGFRYRGRGLIQITGKTEYAEFAATINQTVEQVAAYCETPEGAAMSGCWYLSSHKCLPCADAWDLTSLTRLVNGSKMLGLSQRAAYSNAMLKQLRATPAPESPVA